MRGRHFDNDVATLILLSLTFYLLLRRTHFQRLFSSPLLVHTWFTPNTNALQSTETSMNYIRTIRLLSFQKIFDGNIIWLGLFYFFSKNKCLCWIGVSLTRWWRLRFVMLSTIPAVKWRCWWLACEKMEKRLNERTLRCNLRQRSGKTLIFVCLAINNRGAMTGRMVIWTRKTQMAFQISE